MGQRGFRCWTQMHPCPASGRAAQLVRCQATLLHSQPTAHAQLVVHAIQADARSHHAAPHGALSGLSLEQ